MTAEVAHTVFIVLHAVTGVAAFAAGCPALGRSRTFGTYWWSLVGTTVFLVLAVAVEWRVLDPSTRVVFSALVVLALVMVWRAWAARRQQPPAAGPSGRYFDHVGFTLVSLFDAFVVVTVLNAGSPGWLVAASGVVVAVAGHFVLVSVRRRLVPLGA